MQPGRKNFASSIPCSLLPEDSIYHRAPPIRSIAALPPTQRIYRQRWPKIPGILPMTTGAGAESKLFHSSQKLETSIIVLVLVASVESSASTFITNQKETQQNPKQKEWTHTTLTESIH